METNKKRDDLDGQIQGIGLTRAQYDELKKLMIIDPMESHDEAIKTIKNAAQILNDDAKSVLYVTRVSPRTAMLLGIVGEVLIQQEGK